MKKALLVGISRYAPLLPDLTSSVYEVERWRDLLIHTYGFADDDVRILREHRATKEAVMDRLVWLLAGAVPGDQLVFIFCGHGVRARRSNGRGDQRDLQDEGLIPYPGGVTDMNSIAIFDDDLTTLYCGMSIPPDAMPTFIFDCCYSAGFDFGEQERKTAAQLLPEDTLSSDRGAVNVVRLGFSLARTSVYTPPIVMAASSEYDPAIEVRTSSGPRSLFSSLAIDALHERPSLTYHDLVEHIAPAMQFAGQEPSLGGDAARVNQSFLD